jgi:hypothetical protein
MIQYPGQLMGNMDAPRFRQVSDLGALSAMLATLR